MAVGTERRERVWKGGDSRVRGIRGMDSRASVVDSETQVTRRQGHSFRKGGDSRVTRRQLRVGHRGSDDLACDVLNGREEKSL